MSVTLMQARVKATGVKITGTVEQIEACEAFINGFDGSFDDVDYEGTTDVFWEGQRTTLNEAGERLYWGEDGGTYAESELELYDPNGIIVKEA